MPLQVRQAFCFHFCPFVFRRCVIKFKQFLFSLQVNFSKVTECICDFYWKYLSESERLVVVIQKTDY